MVSFPELAAIRLGYGLSPVHPAPESPEAVLASVAATAARPPMLTREDVREQSMDLNEMRRAQGKSEAFVEYRKALYAQGPVHVVHRLAQAAGAPVGFGERLVQFWADHFSVFVRNVAVRTISTAYIEEALRPNIGASFATLLRAATTHPGMVLYLDQNTSIGPDSPAAKGGRKREGDKAEPAKARGLNENLARELLELHTLGVDGPYTQDDVRALAELLTGLTWDPATDAQFLPRRAQPGPEQVLGKTYGSGGKGSIEDIHAALDDLSVHPATARHLATKLAVHFVSDAPDPALVAALEAAWMDSGGDLPAVYGVLVRHPALAAQFRQKVRQPYDFLAAALRAMGFRTEDVTGLPEKIQRRMLHQPMVAMGQSLAEVPGPNGWPEEGPAWVQPQMLARRISWSMYAPQRLLATLPDPRAFLDAALGSTASEGLVWAVPKAESVREGVGIVLASADFNRR